MNGPRKTLCSLAAVGALLALASSQAWASTTYSTSVTSQSSLTISAATSGMTNADFGVYLVDGNGVKRPTSEYSYSINGSTYSIDITSTPRSPERSN